MLMATFVAGCATCPRAHYPDRVERASITIRTLYEESRTLQETNGVRQYCLITDVGAAAAAEALLLRYSRSDIAEIRQAAACRLAHFGTEPALRRAFELARSEAEPKARAGIWSEIAKLLQSPVTWPAPQIRSITGSSPSTGESNLVQLLSSPELQVVFSCHRPSDFILPATVTCEEIEDAVISQYALDDGQWTVDVLDKIPFVPFSARRYTATWGVREAIADTLRWSAQRSDRILNRFMEFSRSQDAKIREPAETVVNSLSKRNTLIE
jgi:hypothetical protein